MADARRDDQLLLEGAVGVLAEDGHFGAVHLLAGLARRAVAARNDRVQHHLVAELDVADAVTDGIDDARPVGAENGRQGTLRQAAGDEHVKVVERHVAESNADLAGRRARLGSFGELQRGGAIETNQFQSAHADRVVVRAGASPQLLSRLAVCSRYCSVAPLASILSGHGRLRKGLRS